MSAFTDILAAGADFNEDVMGESFAYTSLANVTKSGLVGVFNQVQADFSFEEFSQRKTTDLICVCSKAQWGATVPENRGTITYGGIAYKIERIDGADTGGEACYSLNLKRLT